MSHYFEAPQTPMRPREVHATIWCNDVPLTTANGVFSQTRLDPGTKVLLQHTDPPSGPCRVADIGCGFGPIAIGVALADPEATVTAVDVNPRALELTARNAERHGVAGRVRTLTPEQIGPQERFDQLWSNPPIRIGKAALHELLRTWLARLAPDGQAWFVVSRNLGADSLQRWIIDQGFECDRVASSQGFRVLHTMRDQA